MDAVYASCSKDMEWVEDPGGGRSQVGEWNPVGFYYHSAGREWEEQIEGLRYPEGWLSDQALLIIDHTDWESVERAVADYLLARPWVSEFLRLQGKDHGWPWWGEGVTVLLWACDSSRAGWQINWDVPARTGSGRDRRT